MGELRVLVAADGTEPVVRACELVLRMAQEPIAARLVTVLSYTLYPYAMAESPYSVEGSSVMEVEEAVEQATRDARLTLEKAGIPVTVSHRFGNPNDEILAEAEAWGADMIVLGRRGVRGIERVLGSVSEHVLRRAHVPVLLVP